MPLEPSILKKSSILRLFKKSPLYFGSSITFIEIFIIGAYLIEVVVAEPLYAVGMTWNLEMRYSHWEVKAGESVAQFPCFGGSQKTYALTLFANTPTLTTVIMSCENLIELRLKNRKYSFEIVMCLWSNVSKFGTRHAYVFLIPKASFTFKTTEPCKYLWLPRYHAISISDLPKPYRHLYQLFWM